MAPRSAGAATRMLARRFDHVHDLFSRYDRHYLPNLVPPPAADARSEVNKIVLPNMGTKKVTDATFLDSDVLHRGICEDRPARANRLESLHRSFNRAIGWGWIERQRSLAARPSTVCFADFFAVGSDHINDRFDLAEPISAYLEPFIG